MNFIQMAALCEESRNGIELGDDSVVGLCRMRRASYPLQSESTNK